MQRSIGQARRSTGTGVGLTLAALLLAACGGDGDSGGDTDPAADSGGGEGQSFSATLAAGHPAGGAITYTNYSQTFLVPELEKCVEEETDHTLDIDEQYAGTVAPLGEVLEATQSGVVDIGLVPYPFEPSNLFLFNAAYYVPFGSPDVDVVMDSGRAAFDANPEMAELLDEKFNQRALGFAGVGDYGLFTTFEMDGVDDLEGRKITAAGPNLPWVSAVGATPVQGNLNEWYTGIQTGVYDGGIMFPDAYAGFKLYEVAPNFIDTGFGAVWVGGIHANNDFFDGLPPEVQECFETVSREYEDTFGEAVEADTKKAVEALNAAGVELQEFPEDQRKAWAEALPDIPAEKAAEADGMGLPGTKFMTDYIDAMKEAGYDFPREYEIG